MDLNQNILIGLNKKLNPTLPQKVNKSKIL